MVRYFKLFALLASRGMKKTDLLEVISSPTLAKLSKGETVKTDVIERICHFLHCQPGDIMEVTCYEDSTCNDNVIIYGTKHPADEITPADFIVHKASPNPSENDDTWECNLGWNVDDIQE